MIALLRGVLDSANGERAVVNVAGVGYEVLVPASTLRSLPPPGNDVSLLTHLVVREDALTLYGFSSEGERAAFRLLLTVGGVGPKTGLAILSGVGVSEFASAVRQGSVQPFLGIGGVGRKTAERVILELKDKVASLPVSADGRGPLRSAASPEDDLIHDAVEALASLGVPAAKAKLAVGRAHGVTAGKGGVEALVREALKDL